MWAECWKRSIGVPVLASALLVFAERLSRRESSRAMSCDVPDSGMQSGRPDGDLM